MGLCSLKLFRVEKCAELTSSTLAFFKKKREFVADLDGPIHDARFTKFLIGPHHRGANHLWYPLGTRAANVREQFLQAQIGLLLKF